MDRINRRGVSFTTSTQGPGDLKLSGLYNIMRQNRQSFHLNAGISFPTGSINERDDTPAGSNVRLPYPMQLGSGTRLDLGLGINLYAPKGDLQGARLAVEFELPIYQSLEGPQLETDWQLTLGAQAVF